MQLICLRKDSHPEYTNVLASKPYDANDKKVYRPIKMNKRFEQRRQRDGERAHEMILDIICG